MRRAADDLSRQLRELAARVHEAPANQVRVAAGRVYVPAGRAGGRAPASQAAAEPAQGIGGPLADGSRVADRAAALPAGASGGLAVRHAAAGGPAPRRGSSAPASSRPRIGTDLDTGQGRGAYHWHQGAGGRRGRGGPRDRQGLPPASRHVATHAGRVIDRANAELQNEGRATFGLSQALFEEILLDDGQVTNPNLSDYMIPSLPDFPRAFTTTLAESPLVARDDSTGSEIELPEVHGLGETGLPAVPPAIGNAVAAALGAPVCHRPPGPQARPSPRCTRREPVWHRRPS